MANSIERRDREVLNLIRLSHDPNGQRPLCGFDGNCAHMRFVDLNYCKKRLERSHEVFATQSPRVPRIIQDAEQGCGRADQECEALTQQAPGRLSSGYTELNYARAIVAQIKLS